MRHVKECTYVNLSGSGCGGGGGELPSNIFRWGVPLGPWDPCQILGHAWSAHLDFATLFSARPPSGGTLKSPYRKLIKGLFKAFSRTLRLLKTHLHKKGTGPLSSTTRWKIFSNTSKGIRSDQPFSLSSSRRSSSVSLAFILALIRALIRALDLASNKSSLSFTFSDVSSLQSLLFLLNKKWLSYFRFRPMKVHKLN